MNLAKAQAIFMQINDDRFSVDEKIEAVGIVLQMATHNGVTKQSMLDVIRWLMDNRVSITNINNAGHIEIDMRK